MGTLSTELAPHAGTADAAAADLRGRQRAGGPGGAHARRGSGWDVLFVLEEDDLRRAPDRRHYHLSLQLGRTLVTLDRDYLDDRRFPPGEGGGVLVVSAPDERELSALLARVDRANALPPAGRKLHLHTDWGRDASAESVG